MTDRRRNSPKWLPNVSSLGGGYNILEVSGTPHKSNEHIQDNIAP